MEANRLTPPRQPQRLVRVEATEPVEGDGVGDSDKALLEAADAHETVDEIDVAHDDEVKNLLQ